MSHEDVCWHWQLYREDAQPSQVAEVKEPEKLWFGRKLQLCFQSLTIALDSQYSEEMGK